MSARNSVSPTLELVSTTLPGRLIELDGEQLRIGRDPSSDLWLDLRQVSWKHARIVRRPDGVYVVEDLESYNNTYLDGVRLRPLTPAPLKEGSQIRICDVTLIFRLQAVELREGRTDGTTILGSLDDMSSLGLSSRSERAALVLRAVLEINRTLAGTIELNELLARAVRQLLAIFPQAECGFIVTRESDGKLKPRASVHKEGPSQTPALSRTVLDHVMRDGKALLLTDATTDSRFRSTESISGAGIRTALCVPLLGREGPPIGVIQLDSRVQRATFNQEDLELVAAVAVPIGVTIENHRLLRERASWAAAGEVQTALLPRYRPTIPGYNFWERYQPALEVGGDYYDYIPVESEPGGAGGDGPPDTPRWAVAVGDVTGKGMPAALLMANLVAEVRHLVRSGLGPSEVAERVNRHVYDADLPGRFVTFILMALDGETHRLTVVNAGHMPALLRRADGTVEEIAADDAGLPLGVERDQTYRAATVSLDPGDVVTAYTDGISEAMGRQDTQFGFEALRQAVAAAGPSPARVGDALLRALRAHVGARPQSDDIAVVCLGRG